MDKQHVTLDLDGVQVCDRLGIVMMSGWMRVTEELSNDTERVLTKLQEGLCEPWLAPRHMWVIKNHAVWVFFDEVEPAGLWNERGVNATIAYRGIAALDRIIDIIRAAQSAEISWSSLAEGADRIRKAGIPIIIDEGKE